MWNPFTTPMQSTAYDETTAQQPNAVDETVHADTVKLDDGYVPGGLPYEFSGPMDLPADAGAFVPAYAGQSNRVLIFEGAQQFEQTFLNPAPGSVDLAFPRSQGGIAGTVSENIRNGPVTGFAMDNYGNRRQQLVQTPPGYGGPVVGGTDQGQLAAQAYWQQSMAQYSNEASDQANVTAI